MRRALSRRTSQTAHRSIAYGIGNCHDVKLLELFIKPFLVELETHIADLSVVVIVQSFSIVMILKVIGIPQ